MNSSQDICDSTTWLGKYVYMKICFELVEDILLCIYIMTSALSFLSGSNPPRSVRSFLMSMTTLFSHDRQD